MKELRKVLVVLMFEVVRHPAGEVCVPCRHLSDGRDWIMKSGQKESINFDHWIILSFLGIIGYKVG